MVEIAEQRAAAGQDNTLVDDVGGQFRRRVLEGDLDSLDNRADRLGEALRYLPLADDDLLRHTVHQVAPFDFHDTPFAVFPHAGRADLLLDPLHAALTDGKIMVAGDINEDRLLPL